MELPPNSKDPPTKNTVNAVTFEMKKPNQQKFSVEIAKFMERPIELSFILNK